jgi:hypothetical protein
MPRLRKSRSHWDLTIDPDGTATTSDGAAVGPIRLRFDRHRHKPPFVISSSYAPNEPGTLGSIVLREWRWANGPSGAGTTTETAASYQEGGSEYGEFVWLRRIGAAQPAGKLRELTLPPGTAATTGSANSAAFFEAGRVYGEDLFLTTRTNYIVRLAGALPTGAITERDTGAPGVTLGLAVHAGTGASCLYVGDLLHGIQEWTGTTWNVGAAGTERGWLETPYWVLGDQSATGGLAGSAGEGIDALVATNSSSSGMFHVAGDPKIAANWSATYTVGTGGGVFPIHRLVASNRTVWAATGQGILGIDALGRSPNLTQWMELTAHLENCRQVVFWDGLLWVAHVQGLVVFAPDGSRVDFGTFLQFGAKSGTTPIYGFPRALSPTPDGLLVGYWNDDDSYIGCLVKDPGGSYRWSMAECVIRGERVTYLQQVTGTDGTPRTFIGTVGTDDRLHLYWQSLPRSGDPANDYLHDGPFEAAEDWSLRLSRTDGQQPVSKTLRRLMAGIDQLGDDHPENTVTVRVAEDGGAFAVAGVANESPRWSSTPTAALVSAVDFQVELVVHNTTAEPVVIRDVAVRYSPHPELTKTKTYPVVFGDGETGQDPALMLAALERAQDAGPLTVEDELGRTIEGIVEPGLQEQYVEQEPGKGFVVRADVTISTTRSSAVFDDALFDVDAFS